MKLSMKSRVDVEIFVGEEGDRLLSSGHGSELLLFLIFVKYELTCKLVVTTGIPTRTMILMALSLVLC